MNNAYVNYLKNEIEELKTSLGKEWNYWNDEIGYSNDEVKLELLNKCLNEYLEYEKGLIND